jgi:hypothetical protein
MPMPTARIVRSPAQSISLPQTGLATKRIRANAETTAPISRLPTPKLFTYTGRTGTTTPKPTITKNAMTPST